MTSFSTSTTPIHTGLPAMTSLNPTASLYFPAPSPSSSFHLNLDYHHHHTASANTAPLNPNAPLYFPTPSPSFSFHLYLDHHHYTAYTNMAPLNPNARLYFPSTFYINLNHHHHTAYTNTTFFHASVNKKFKNISRVKSQQHKLQDGHELFLFKEEQGDDEKRTTVMIKNLPNKLVKSTLLKMLDDHCAEENKNIMENSIVSEFNFLYLPIDFKSGSNLGYAFVNFTSAKAARRFYHVYHNRSWNQLHGSFKICEVTYARIQGLPALQKRFKTSVFVCDNEDYLPVYFSPSRNGSCDSKQHFIGRKVL